MVVRSAVYKVMIGEVMFNIRLEDVKTVLVRKTLCWDLLHKVAVGRSCPSGASFLLIVAVYRLWRRVGSTKEIFLQTKHAVNKVQFCWIFHKSLTLTKNPGTFAWQKDKCPVLINCNHFHWVKRHNQFTKAVFQLIASILI